MRRSFSLLLSICLLISVAATGCKNQKKKVSELVPGSDAYSCISFDYPVKDGYEVVSSKAFRDDGNFRVSALYRSTSTTSCFTDIFTINDKGETTMVLEMPGNQLPSAVFPDEYAYIGVNNSDIEDWDDEDDRMISDFDSIAVFLDKNTGEVTRTVVPEFYATFIQPIQDGFVIGGPGNVAQYSSDGILQSSVQTDFMVAYQDAFFEEDGTYYVVEEDDEEDAMAFHKVDFSTGTCERIASDRDFDRSRPIFQGKYCFMGDGEYKADMKSKSLYLVTDWNNVDIRPEKKALRTSVERCPIDDDHFSIRYLYRDGTSEMLIYSYDSSVKASLKEKITIGGYQISHDLALKWIVYNFNTSNNDYRAVLEDYGKEFGGNTPEEEQRARLNLIKSFSDGHTPDIFYGQYFDYEYMGRIGMVADIRSYIDKSPELLDDLTDTAKGLMINGEGKCYKVYASYTMSGCVGLKSNFPEGNDVSIYELQKMATDKEIPIYSSLVNPEYPIAELVLYSFSQLWGIYDQNSKITVDQVKDLVDYAVTPENIAVADHTNTRSSLLSDETYLLRPLSISNIFDLSLLEKEWNINISYIGYPSFEGSVHLAVPQCCLAMSSSTANPDKCWELMSEMFSIDVQKTIAANGTMPTNQEALDMLCQAYLSPNDVEDEVLASAVHDNKPVKQSTVDDYLEAVYSADALATYDWGIYTIVRDEVNSYYTQNRSTEQIAESIMKRLDLYAEENYQ